MSDEFFDRAAKELFPMMKNAAMSITLVGEPDPKLCMELGAAIMYDKPIIAVVPVGRRIPANLKRVASAIVQGDVSDPKVRQQLQDAISRVFEGDQRVKQ